ncbi:MAG: hypothetical protein Q4B54_11395 [Coriobacteriales bacterium]|nr:hypothetical protein [Coriobacteriales bacterium]
MHYKGKLFAACIGFAMRVGAKLGYLQSQGIKLLDSNTTAQSETMRLGATATPLHT